MPTLPEELQAAYGRLAEAIVQGDKTRAFALLTPDAQVTDIEGDILPLRDWLDDFFWTASGRQLSHAVQRVHLRDGSAEVELHFDIQTASPPSSWEADLIDFWQYTQDGWRLASRTVQRDVAYLCEERQVFSATPPALKRQRLERLLSHQYEWEADPAQPTQPLPWFDDLLLAVKVVGAGEGTHGTREHFSFKHWLFRYLVKQHGFTVLAFEESLSRTWGINEYLLGQTDIDPRAKLSGWMWPWANEEVLALFEWMRDYNAERGTRPPVQVVGVDMQDTAGAIELLLQLGPAEWQPILKRLQGIAVSSTAFHESYLELARREAELASSAPQSFCLRALIRQIGQADALEQAENEIEGMRIRDVAMADNLMHVLADAKVMFWAHNGHVRRGGAYFYPEFTTTGSVLSERLGAAYLCIGLGSFGGEALFYQFDQPAQTAVQPVPLRTPPQTAVLPRPGGRGVAAFHWAGLPQQQDWSWLSSPAKFYEAGAIYSDETAKYNHYVLPQTFDLLVGTGPSAPATPLKSSPESKLERDN